MKDFFRYNNPFTNKEIFHDLSFFECIIPITIVYTIIILLAIYKNEIKDNEKLDKIFRLVMGFLLSGILILHYLLLWVYDGFSIDSLPFSFYALTSIICAVLAFTKNKKIYSLALYLGVIGGMINILANQVGYSYQYFRYYQFMIGNGLLIIIPLYFLIIHDYLPSLKRIWKELVVIQGSILFILLFNFIFETNFMYLTIGKDSAYPKTIISYLGSWPFYLIWVELIGCALIILISGITNFCVKKFGHRRNRFKHSIVSRQSIYITKKKK